MDLIWSLGLIVVILLALNHMAGGRASNVLRPVAGIANGVLSFAVRLCMSGMGAVARLIGSSVGSSLKLPPEGSKTNRESGPTLSISEVDRTVELNIRGLCDRLLMV